MIEVRQPTRRATVEVGCQGCGKEQLMRNAGPTPTSLCIGRDPGEVRFVGCWDPLRERFGHLQDWVNIDDRSGNQSSRRESPKPPANDAVTTCPWPPNADNLVDRQQVNASCERLDDIEVALGPKRFHFVFLREVRRGRVGCCEVDEEKELKRSATESAPESPMTSVVTTGPVLGPVADVRDERQVQTHHSRHPAKAWPCGPRTAFA